MSFPWLLLTAIGMGMDCTAVSLALGLAHPKLGRRRWAPIATFGLFQMGMCLLGWLAGRMALLWIEAYARWIAFGLLALVGSLMLKESLEGEGEEKEPQRWRPDHPLSLLTLGVATSIDSLGVGFSFRLIEVDILTASLVIGVVSSIMSWGAFKTAERLGTRWESRFEGLGGVILIFIGLKILLLD